MSGMKYKYIILLFFSMFCIAFIALSQVNDLAANEKLDNMCSMYIKNQKIIEGQCKISQYYYNINMPSDGDYEIIISSTDRQVAILINQEDVGYSLNWKDNEYIAKSIGWSAVESGLVFSDRCWSGKISRVCVGSIPWGAREMRSQ